MCLVYLVDHADVGMIERRRCLRHVHESLYRVLVGAEMGR